MISTLLPEILVKIIHHLCDVEDGSDDSKRERQQILGRLMTVSKSFNQICTTALYKDCLVSSPLSFLEGLSTPSSAKKDQLSKVQTLRICHTPSIPNFTYSRLMSDSRKWKATGHQGGLEGGVTDLELETDWQLRFDTDESLKAAIKMREAINKGVEVMPRLKRVVMTCAVDSDDAVAALQVAKGISDILVSLPKVEYYCQSSALGPLSLLQRIYQPLYPPKIATFHLSRSSVIWKTFALPPIILGSVNRYVWSGTLRIQSQIPLIAADITVDFVEALSWLVNMLCLRKNCHQEVVHGNFDLKNLEWTCAAPVPFTSVSLDNTSIEMYNCVVNVISLDHVMDALNKEPERVVPLSREVCEAIERVLDTKIGRWRGKIRIRNGNEFPICPACDYDGPIPTNEAATYRDDGILGHDFVAE